MTVDLSSYVGAHGHQQQICGVAIANKMGPNNANLFVVLTCFWRNNLIFEQFTDSIPDSFGRNKDDCVQ